MSLFGQLSPLDGSERRRAERCITDNHYTHGLPSGKSHVFEFETAIVMYSIPANYNIGRFLMGAPANVWELTRLWAPDGHAPNLLTRAISATVAAFRCQEPGVVALVSYADPNAGHAGGVYRAASWVYTGQSEEARYYVGPDGQSVARRKFHSGATGKTKAAIEALGFVEEKRPGKHRFVHPLTRAARKIVAERWIK